MSVKSGTGSLFERQQQHNTYCPKTHISMDMPDYIEKNGPEYTWSIKWSVGLLQGVWDKSHDETSGNWQTVTINLVNLKKGKYNKRKLK